MLMKKVWCLVAIFSLMASSFLFDFGVSAQDMAIYRGYRTGYSDGYMAGYRDATEGATKSYERHQEYKKADRGYRPDFGSLTAYKDGYQQGFEKGYDDGYEKRSFNSEVPTDLKMRSRTSENTDENSTGATKSNGTTRTDGTSENNDNKVRVSEDDSVVTIPVDAELLIELDQEISTETSKEGDKFTAKVISPRELSGAVIEGRVSKIQKAGRIRRRAELLLSFDIIKLNDNRWANYNAMVIEVLPAKGDNVKTTDNEGTIQGKSSIKEDAIKVGTSAGAGAVVGGVLGGPVGVAVGAGVGAAFGVGTIFAERGKQIRLARGQVLRIRTAYETKIR